jgi:group I intron endonuclease
VYYVSLNDKESTMTQGIYKIINVINNKFYVGSAVNFSRRKTRHFSELRGNKHSNAKLQNAWTKYGEAAFVFVIVEELEIGVDILAAETVWLKQHVGKDYCYNLGVDATAPMLGMVGSLSPTWGYKHTATAKARISKTSKARIQTDEEKSKRIKTMQGHFVAPSTRAKISASLSGEKNFNYGKPRSQGFIDKVSKAVVASDGQGKQTLYPSISELRVALDIKPPTVNRALKSGCAITRGRYTGWSFKYA